jgi:hypothetical protein
MKRNSADILLGKNVNKERIKLRTETDNRKRSIWSLNSITTEYVYGQTPINHLLTCKGKCKAIPVKAWTGPWGPRRLRLPDFMTIGTYR